LGLLTKKKIGQSKFISGLKDGIHVRGCPMEESLDLPLEKKKFGRASLPHKPWTMPPWSLLIFLGHLTINGGLIIYLFYQHGFLKDYKFVNIHASSFETKIVTIIKTL